MGDRVTRPGRVGHMGVMCRQVTSMAARFLFL